MESYLFADVEAAADTMVVEGYHKPGSLTRSSGAWIHAAGTAMFEAGDLVRGGGRRSDAGLAGA